MVTAPIRIGIAGTHSTGKTVLMRRIEMELRAIGLTVARTHGLGKRAAAAGLPKMHRHTALSTEWIIAAGVADELAGATNADIVLADRACIDALAYYTAAVEHRNEQIDPQTLGHLEQLVAMQMPAYVVLFATVLDPSAPVIARHDYDPAYRRLVDSHLHQRLRAGNHEHHLVHNDPASREAAIQAALGAIDKSWALAPIPTVHS
ncbi:AAA family ATPase [Streptomyces sp. SID13031]|uniref:AAA family ATPase n=1 Tax=Streptomyces sp. SID13031 TaxID=2706046 RepID=UPI0013CA2940|nr:AAA family ATPase [Streptomyces sp. SID13031]NEA35000.1 AAA family ATPase [Streptomyces sp. SID13031]